MEGSERRMYNMNRPCDIGVLGDDISLQSINQVFIFSSSVEPLHLSLHTIRFIL